MIRSEIEWWANSPKLAMEGNYRKSQWEKRFFSKTCKFFIRYGQWFEFNGLNLTLSNEIQSGHKLRLATPDTNKQINDQWCLFHLRIAMKAIYVKSKIFRKKNKCRALSRILNDRFNEYSVYIILDLLIKIDVSYDAKWWCFWLLNQ